MVNIYRGDRIQRYRAMSSGIAIRAIRFIAGYADRHGGLSLRLMEAWRIDYCPAPRFSPSIRIKDIAAAERRGVIRVIRAIRLIRDRF